MVECAAGAGILTKLLACQSSGSTCTHYKHKSFTSKSRIAGLSVTQRLCAGAPQLGGATLPQGMTGPQLLRQQMDVAVHHGLTVMRFWVPGVSPQFATQLSPGVYNEAMLEGSLLSLEMLIMAMSLQSAYACRQDSLQRGCTLQL